MTKLEEALEYLSAVTNPPDFNELNHVAYLEALKKLKAAIKEQQVSLLDYYMAHAPVEPQEWFSPEMPPRPEPISDPNNEYVINREELIKWRFEFDTQRFLQWPRAWAEEMLKQRGK